MKGGSYNKHRGGVAGTMAGKLEVGVMACRVKRKSRKRKGLGDLRGSGGRGERIRRVPLWRRDVKKGDWRQVGKKRADKIVFGGGKCERDPLQRINLHLDK